MIEIVSMKDLKQALNSVPDEVLDNFQISIAEPDCDLHLSCGDTDEFGEGMLSWNAFAKKYPVIKAIDGYFNSVIKLARTEELEDEIAYFSDEELRGVRR